MGARSRVHITKACEQSHTLLVTPHTAMMFGVGYLWASSLFFLPPEGAGEMRPAVRGWRAEESFTMSAFRDAEHLFRLVGVFLAGVVMFLIVREFLVPKSFGQYGHYRGAALAELAARPVNYAGHQTCEGCHADVLEKKKDGRHAHVNCEACHGALAKHADDPTSVTPQKLDTAVLCVRCHEANAAKPKSFPQVASADHSGGVPCDTCHQPHSPAITAGGAQ
jgi:hypothetical protein